MPRWSGLILGIAVLCVLWPGAGPGRAEDAGSAAEHGHAAGAADHHDPYDLSHQNATPVLEDPTEIRSDLALWTLVVFLLLLGLLLKFAWRPIIDGLEKREHSIAAMINEAKLSAEKAAGQLAQYEARLAAASAEAQQIIIRAQKDAEAVKDQIVTQAQTAAKKERDRAVADIENAKNSALQEMTRKSVDLAAFMASRIVRRQLRPEDQAQLIREALDQLPSRNQVGTSIMVEVSHPTVFDSVQQHVGATYAKALLGASEKVGLSETAVAELESLITDVFDRLPRLEQALSSPRVPFDRKEQMLEQALRGAMTPLLLNFLKVVTRRGRLDSLRAISRAARLELQRLRGRIEVQVQSAEPLDPAAQALVAQRLSAALGRQVELRLQVVPQIVAGLVIRVGDTVYDGSVANRLARLADEIAARANQKIRQDSHRFATSG